VRNGGAAANGENADYIVRHPEGECHRAMVELFFLDIRRNPLSFYTETPA
jgi:hypothetical protein